MKECIFYAGLLSLTALLHTLTYLMALVAKGNTKNFDFYFPPLAMTAIVLILCVHFTIHQLIL